MKKSPELEMVRRLSWRWIWTQWRACLRDDRGVAMTEYLLVTLVTLPLVFILFHPDNGFYHAAREQYELTRLLVILPMP
jgi:hypothetical protein